MALPQIRGCLGSSAFSVFFLVCAFGTFAQGVSSQVGGLAATPTRNSPSSVFWNPAGLGLGEQTEIETNISLMGGWLIYDRQSQGARFDSSDTQILAPNPFLSITSPLGTKNFRFGYSTYFPSGAIGQFDAQGAQRYHLISGMFLPWHHQLTLSYQLTDQITIGAGLVYSIGFFKTSLDVDQGSFFSQVMDLSQDFSENPSLSSRVNIPRSTAHAFGGSLGILYRPNIQWSAGLSYQLPLTYVFETEVQLGRASFFEAVDVASQAVGYESVVPVPSRVKMQLPGVLAGGIRYQPFGYWTGEYFGRYVMASFTRFTSVQFKNSPIQELTGQEMLGAKARDSYLVGTSQSFEFWRGLIFGLVTSYHWNGVPDERMSTSRVDFDTLNIGTFARYRFSPSFQIGAEYSHSVMMSRQINNSSPPSSEQVSIIDTPASNGLYRAGLDRFGVSINYAF